MATDVQSPHQLYAIAGRVHKLGPFRYWIYRSRLRVSCVIPTAACILIIVVIAFVIISSRASYSSQRSQVSVDFYCNIDYQ